MPISDFLFSSAGAAPSGASVHIDDIPDFAGERVDLVKSHAGNRDAIPKSWFTDPFALLDSLGLGYKASPSGLSYETLKQMAENNVIIAAIHQVRVNQVASFVIPQRNKYSVGFRISRRYDKDRRLTASERDKVRYLERFMLQCGDEEEGDRDDLVVQTEKIVRDRLTFAQIATEIVNKFSGRPHAFYAVPGSTFRLAQPKHRKGTPLLGQEGKVAAKYIQIIDGVIVNTYTKEELGFSVANPRTDIRAWGYGYSELEMLIRTVTSHLWAEEWNRKQFSQGSTTKGILNIRGNIPPQQLDAFKRQWLTQISGVSNAWRTPIINSNDDIQWVQLQGSNEEMGFQQWMEYLIKIAAAIYLIDPSEINFDIRGGVAQNPMFMSTNEAQQKLSQDRGLRPLLRHVQDHYNRHILWRIDPNFEFEFVGIDAKTEEQAIELRLKELNAYKSLNEVREADQLPPVPHGEIIPNPTYVGYVNQQNMMEQQQQQMGGAGGAPGGEEMGGPPGAIAGFPGADKQMKRGPEEDKAKDALQRELDGGGEKKHRRLPDRYFHEEGEEWETTYNASVDDVDLRKALEPFDALADD